MIKLAIINWIIHSYGVNAKISYIHCIMYVTNFKTCLTSSFISNKILHTFTKDNIEPYLNL